MGMVRQLIASRGDSDSFTLSSVCLVAKYLSFIQVTEHSIEWRKQDVAKIHLSNRF